MISFSVLGLPIPQGSKKHVGRGIMVDTNGRQLLPWRNDMMVAGKRAMDARRQVPFHEVVDVHLQFIFPRPRAHFGTGRNADRLKESAPLYMGKAPDLDKLIRAVGDALTGIVINDDKQIARILASKTYGDPPGVKVTVVPLQERAEDRLVEASGGDVMQAVGVKRMLGA